MPQLIYKCNEFTTAVKPAQRTDYDAAVIVNRIKYRVTSVGDHTIYLELYGFPTTLRHYLLILCHFDEGQYQQWCQSLSTEQYNYVPGVTGSVAEQLDHYQCSYNCGTLVYNDRHAWHAVNTELHATATASTLAELLNCWAEATEHVRHDV